MNVLWLTWKDRKHPEAGGAEVVCGELVKRLAAEGHKVTILTARYPGAKAREQKDGIDIIRVGANRYIHPVQASLHYQRYLRNRFDVVIEEIQGCAPYFAAFFGRKARRFIFYHQLARKNWLYEVRTPFSHLGHHVLAPVATRLVALSRVPVITVSESTRQALAPYGFHPGRTHIISEGIEIKPATDLQSIQKYRHPTILSLGAMRAMKRTIDQIKAFELAKEQIPDLGLKIAGNADSPYGESVLRYINQSPFAADIYYLGKVSEETKIKLLQKSHLILQTSIEEGWGLTVTEAASQGTPTVAYDVDGLRDSIRHNETGLVTPERPAALADAIVVALRDPELYRRWRYQAWEWSKSITFDQSYQDFKQVTGIA